MKGFYTTLFALFLLVVCVSAALTESATDVERKETGVELMEDNTDGLDVSVRSGYGYYGRGRGSYGRGRRGSYGRGGGGSYGRGRRGSFGKGRRGKGYGYYGYGY